MEPDREADPRPPRRRSLADLRYLAIVAVAGLTATTLATFGLAVAKTVTLFDKVIDNGWKNELVIVAVLEAVDSYLLAVVQLIVVVGLYELFIADLELPGWLEARSLQDLKKPIIDVLVVFVAIKGIERFLVTEDPLDGLAAVGAVTMLIVGLTVFLALTGQRGAKRS